MYKAESSSTENQKKFPIFIKEPTGEIHRFSVRPDMTVGELHLAIRKALSISVGSGIWLHYARKVPSVALTLYDAHITPEVTLHMHREISFD